jgi:hypothetical protein
MRLCVYVPELIAIYILDHQRHLVFKGLIALGPGSDDTANHSLKMA